MTKIVTIEDKRDEKFLRAATVPFDIKKLKDASAAKEIRALIKQMREIMNRANGVGLSANQIGIRERFFVAQMPTNQGAQKFYAIFNPEIIKKSKEIEGAEEGCLSIPEIYGNIKRHYEIILSGYDLRGKKIKIKAWGFLARVFQHEVDHLDGKLFMDAATDLRKINQSDQHTEII